MEKKKIVRLLVGLLISAAGICGFLFWLVLYSFGGQGGPFDAINLPFTIFCLGGSIIIFIGGICYFFLEKIGVVLIAIGVSFYVIFQILR